MRPGPALAAALAAGVLVGAAGCGDDDSPTIEEGARDGTTSSAASSAATTEPRTTDRPAGEVQEVELELTGAEVVPGPGADGTARATLTYDGDQLCLSGTTEGLGPVSGGHAHAAPAGEAGPIVVDFGITTDGDGGFEGCATVGAEGGVVVVDPASYYVQLHTAQHPNGAVRAQVG